MRHPYLYALLTLLTLTSATQAADKSESKARTQTPWHGLDQAGQTIENGLKMKLAFIPKGTFIMGSPADELYRYSDETQHEVTLTRDFLIGVTEVTQSQWQAIMNTTVDEQASKREAEKEAQKARITLFKKAVAKFKITMQVKAQKDRTNLQTKAEAQATKTENARSKEGYKQAKKDGFKHMTGPNYPMGYVSHQEAQKFCEMLTKSEQASQRLPLNWHYRLPTEAEWEYAARAGTKGPVYFGEQPKLNKRSSLISFRKISWINPHALNKNHPVAQLKPNAWGLYDTLGNTTEWVLDYYMPFNEKASVDPLITSKDTGFPDSMPVYRGLTAHNGPRDVRVARRKTGGPRVPYWRFFGFRVVCAINPDTNEK